MELYNAMSGFSAGTLDHLKPTQLPDGTIIETEENHFEKGEGFWHSLHDHCLECGIVVVELPTELVDSPGGYPRRFIDADSYFAEFKVVSVPYISNKKLSFEN